MTQNEARELIPLHALGALDAATANAVEDYLRQAPLEEQREAAEFREVAACLPFALLSPAVPTTLKGRLLKRISEDLSEGEIAGQVLEFKPRLRVEERRSPRFTQWLAVAASLVLAAVSAFLFWQNRQLRNERATVTQQLQATQRELDRMLAPSTRIITLAGKEAPQASAKLIWDTARDEWVLQIFNLPVPPAEMDYQLWYVTKDTKLSAAVFRPDAQGRHELRLSLPAEIASNLAATAVTLEPKGGSPQPTGKFYLLAEI
jgi:anti-sigma-K factor RskA